VARLLSLFFLFASVAAPPIAVAIRPVSADSFTVVASGDAAGDASGAFSGTIAFNGAGDPLAVAGRAERTGSRLRIALPLRYAQIPADWASRVRPGFFDYRLPGTVAGRDRVEWAGTLPWKDVSIEGEREVVSGFVRLSSLEVTRFSLFESEARAVVSVRNPFSFPLKLAGASYRLFANGREVGSGQTPGLLLRQAQDNDLDFPIEIEHGELLGAAGSALAAGGEVDGRLVGQLSVRLPQGDVAVPLDLSGKLDLLSP